MRATTHRLSARAYFATGTLALLALLAQPRAARAQQPWSTPDTSGNINNTNTGNVGVGTGSSAPAARFEIRGATSDATSTAFKISNSAAASLFFVSSNGNVGIGTTGPTSKLQVQADSTSTTTYATGLTVSGTQSTANTAGYIGGLFNSVYTAGTGNTLFQQVPVDALSQNTSTGTVTLQYGVLASPQNTSTGTVSVQMGIDNVPYNVGGGTVSSMYGEANQPINNSTGSVTSMFGTYTQAQNNSTGIISNLYGLYIDNPINPSGTITNKYAIVTAANAGNVGIGTASPNEKLHVNGGMVVTGAASETIGVNGLFFGFNPGGNTASIDAVQQGTDFRNLNVSAKNFSVLSWNGSAQVLGLYQNNSGNVGVGTSPAYNYKLDVAGPVRSSSGGFVFPDGTSQTTAATPVSYGSTAGTAVQGNTSLSLTAGTGISGGGTVTLGSGGSVTLTNADRGSSQSIFKNVTNGSGAVQFSAGSNNDAISFEGAGGTSVTFNAAAKKVVINSAAAQSSGWTDSGSSVSLTNGSASVGVGTAAPVRGLHVSGANGTAGAEVAIANTGMPAAYRNFNFWGDSAAGTSGRWYVRALNDTGTASGRDFLTFDNASGNVGAGTASPAAKLDVRVASLGAGSNTMLWSPSGTADANTSYVHFGTAGDWYIRPGTTAGRVVIADNGGNVGIGTAGPGYKLDVAGSVNGSGLCIAGDCKTGWAQVGASQWTTSNSNIYYSTGSVGIGTQAPAAGAKLDVAGNLNVSAGNVTVSGDITATGTINAKFQDMAEWVPAAKFLPAGTVVVLDATHNNQVTTSSRAYDTRVAGVVSPQPGITLGERGEGKALVATTGRVRVKVDATRAPISVGDLLVTSDIEGVAMKSIPVDLGGVQIHRPGTIIGKALEPLEKGKGEILVLLSLQ